MQSIVLTVLLGLLILLSISSCRTYIMKFHPRPSERTHTVSFHANLPKGVDYSHLSNMPENLTDVTHGSKITIDKQPQITGASGTYHFDGWCTSPDPTLQDTFFNPETDTVTSDLDLYANVDWSSLRLRI